MGEIIKELIKKWGIKKILEYMIDYFQDHEGSKERQLARDLRVALDNYKNN